MEINRCGGQGSNNLPPLRDPFKTRFDPFTGHMLDLAIRRKHPARHQAGIVRRKPRRVENGNLVPGLQQGKSIAQAHNPGADNSDIVCFCAHTGLKIWAQSARVK